MRHLTAIAVAVLIAAIAFVFRFNTLGGTLGGFDNDEFAHLLRSQALLRGEQPLRDFADAELRGAWPALSYPSSPPGSRLNMTMFARKCFSGSTPRPPAPN